MSSESGVPPKKRVDVAVAVVFNSAGEVLWACRPEGKPYAGYWEFPGGKVEPGESVWQCLVRELKEELDITCTEGGPWFRIEHDYEHAAVRLHLYRVWQYTGQPRALEQQQFTWAPLNSRDPAQPNLAPILPATAPLLPILAQPTFMALSSYGQGFEACARRLESWFAQLTEPVYLQFREKELSGEVLRRAFLHAQSLCVGTPHQLVVNSACLNALESACGEAIDCAVHLTEHDLNSPEPWLGRSLVGASVHSAVGLEKAFLLGLKYTVLGAVKATASHPGQDGLGWAAFQQLAIEARLPVFAIGGLCASDAEVARRNGAHGIAVLSRLGLEN